MQRAISIRASTLNPFGLFTLQAATSVAAIFHQTANRSAVSVPPSAGVSRCCHCRKCDEIPENTTILSQQVSSAGSCTSVGAYLRFHHQTVPASLR